MSKKIQKQKKLTYEPSEYLKSSIKKSMEEYKKGDYIEFDSIEKATEYVDDLIAEDKKQIPHKQSLGFTSSAG